VTSAPLRFGLIPWRCWDSIPKCITGLRIVFTGIVQDIGTVVQVRRLRGDVRLSIQLDKIRARDCEVGDSVAVNGACLTVVGVDDSLLGFDVSRESLANTVIGDWSPGDRVNLELALLPTTRLGGHLVSGHVDGVVPITAMEKDARSWRIVIDCPSSMSRYVARKGSVTIDGVSLTVNEVSPAGFGVNIVPHTWEATIFGGRAVGDRVHIEVDQVARYIEQLLVSEGQGGSAQTDEDVRNILEKSGFIGQGDK
jgi:riboflavin synthase